MIPTLDAASQGYLSAVRRVIVEELGPHLVGCYVYGSALTSEFLPGRSDLDMLTLTRTWMPEATEQGVVDRLRTLPRPAALKGLDIWFLPLAVSMNPGDTPGYQVRMLTSLDFVHRDAPARYGDPRLAMLLAICRNHSAVVEGPRPVSVIGRVPLAGILSGMLADLGSHAPAHYRVLNACRDQHFLDEGKMCSKLQGVAWARGRLAPPDLLDTAVEWHVYGTGPAMDGVRVDTFVTAVADRLRDAVQLGDVPAACDRWRQLDPTPQDGPKVICMMPTYNRRRFVEQSIRLFIAQDYANRELVILDDGEDEVSDLVPAGASVRYVRMKGRSTIGEKRNVGAQDTDADIVVQWDDDDWYGPSRLSRQVGPLVAGRADLTAIHKSWLADLDEGRFYRRRFQPQRLSESLAVGTIAMTTDLWRRSGRYPDASKREDITMFLRATDIGAHVESVANDGMYVYVRHGANSWRFDRAPSDHGWWFESPPPGFISRRDLDCYFRAGNVRTTETRRRRESGGREDAVARRISATPGPG
jgi:hypothetical protein